MMIVYERKECSRCGGTGRYSYNALHGSMCYGCNGRGRALSKRGLAAKRAVTASTRPLDLPPWDLLPGDTLRRGRLHAGDAGDAMRDTVEVVSAVRGPNNTADVVVKGADGALETVLGVYWVVRRFRTDADRAAMIAAALEFPGGCELVEEEKQTAD